MQASRAFRTLGFLCAILFAVGPASNQSGKGRVRWRGTLSYSWEEIDHCEKTWLDPDGEEQRLKGVWDTIDRVELRFESEDPFLNEIRDLPSYQGKCGRCAYLKICGGCRARAYTVTGDYLAADPICDYEPGTKK